MRRPTRKELLMVIGRLQTLIGTAQSRANDRNPNRAADLTRILRHAQNLCIDARGFDPIIEGRGEWGDTSGDAKVRESRDY